MKRIKQIMKKIYKTLLYVIVITTAISAIISIGYFLIPYFIDEHNEPQNFSAVLRDKIYESKLPEVKELDYVVKKYGIKSIVFFNNPVNKKSAYLFQYVNNNKLHLFLKSTNRKVLNEHENTIDFIDFINAKSNQPVLICSDNKSRTDKLIAIYRIACLYWEFDDAMSETRNSYNSQQQKAIKTFAFSLKNKQQALNNAVQNTNNAISFVVLGDANYKVWQGTLRNIWRNCVKNQPVPASFIVGVGDMIHSKNLYLIYKEYFNKKKVKTPVYLPALGNHEVRARHKLDKEEVRDTIIPSIQSVVRYNKTTCNYYLDSKNTRFIIIDPYSDLGNKGVINEVGRQWTEMAITSSPEKIQHIFLFFHEPAFPRARHFHDSFDANPKLRNLFWKMLMRHKKKVRAVFCGHTHHYYKMKIADPESKEANSAKFFPMQKGGIYQIDVGAAGRSQTLNETYVQTIVADNKITVKVFQRKRETIFSQIKEKLFKKDKYSNIFKLTDSFQIFPEEE